MTTLQIPCSKPASYLLRNLIHQLVNEMYTSVHVKLEISRNECFHSLIILGVIQ